MSTPSKKKQPVKPVAKKKAPVKKPSKPRSNRIEKDFYVDFRGPEDVASEQMEILSDENAELKDKLINLNDRYEAVKERLSELNSRDTQPAQESKIQAEHPKDITRSERILARFGEELNHFNHVSDLIDGKIEAIGGNSTQKDVIDNAKPSAFLDELEVCIARFEVANKRNLLMFDHLCKII